MSVKFNRERAAQALVDAILMGDRAAAEKYNVTIKSIQGWRVRLDTDQELRQFFQEFKRVKDESWADDLPAALASCIQYLKEAAQQVSKTDPVAIASIAQAAETLSDIALTSKIVNERLSQDRSEDEAA